MLDNPVGPEYLTSMEMDKWYWEEDERQCVLAIIFVRHYEERLCC